MRKVLIKNLTAFAVIMMLVVPMFTLTVHNASANVDAWGENEYGGLNAVAGIGLGNADPRAIAASVIKVMLGFLGIIAVLIILFAGFLWMTAAGNEDKITQAKGMMSAGVIGLIIILAAFGIATFVMNALVTATA